MAKDTVADWDEDPDENQDLAGVDINSATGKVKDGAKVFRTMMAQIKAAIGVSFQAFSAAILFGNVENQAVTGGATVTSKALGTITTGTLTLDVGDCALQHYTNNGAHTLAPGAVTGAAMIDILNGSSAAIPTTSGFTKVSGDSLTATNAAKFRCHVSVGQNGSLLVVQAMT